jgi:hypothetical protein
MLQGQGTTRSAPVLPTKGGDENEDSEEVLWLRMRSHKGRHEERAEEGEGVQVVWSRAGDGLLRRPRRDGKSIIISSYDNTSISFRMIAAPSFYGSFARAAWMSLPVSFD